MNKRTKHNVVIEATDHSLMQLYDRYFFDTYRKLIDGELVQLYPDVDEKSNVFYYNLVPTGFIVLRKTELNKFVIITVTLDEHRNYGEPMTLIRPNLRERQSEYEL